MPNQRQRRRTSVQNESARTPKNQNKPPKWPASPPPKLTGTHTNPRLDNRKPPRSLWRQRSESCEGGLIVKDLHPLATEQSGRLKGHKWLLLRQHEASAHLTLSSNNNQILIEEQEATNGKASKEQTTTPKKHCPHKNRPWGETEPPKDWGRSRRPQP